MHVTESVANNIISLPIYPELSIDESLMQSKIF